MNSDSIESKVKLMKLFEQNGYLISEDSETEQLELDSLQFISILCDVENEFEISIPDDFFSGEGLSTFVDFYDLIKNLKEGNR